MMLLVCVFVYFLSLASAACNETREAYAFTVHDQPSAIHALVTAQSLKDAGHTKETVVVVNDHAVSPLIMEMLNAAFDTVEPVTLPDWFSHTTWVIEASARQEVMAALPTMYLWRLTQYKRLVHLDSHVLVLQPVDELFLQHGFAAVPQAGWPQGFDSGVMVLTPSPDVFDRLLSTAIESGFTWNGASIINHIFKEWTPLSPIYNTPDLNSNQTAAGYELSEATKVIKFVNYPMPWTDVYYQDEDVLHGSENDVGMRYRWWHTLMKVKATALVGQKPTAVEGNSMGDEKNQDEVDSELARFRGARAASKNHVRRKRSSDCCASCWWGSCCCDNDQTDCGCNCSFGTAQCG